MALELFMTVRRNYCWPVGGGWDCFSIKTLFRVICQLNSPLRTQSQCMMFVVFAMVCVCVCVADKASTWAAVVLAKYSWQA